MADGQKDQKKADAARKDQKNKADADKVREAIRPKDLGSQIFGNTKRGQPCVTCGEVNCRGHVYYAQETPYSCEIASTRMILRDHGVVFNNESDLAGDFSSFNFERTQQALRDNLPGVDIKTGDYQSLDDIRKALDGGKNSLILALGRAGDDPSHAVVVDGISPEGKLLVRDPGADPGCREIDQKELQRRAFNLEGLAKAGRYYIAVPKK